MNILCRAGCIALTVMLLVLSFASCAEREPNEVPSAPGPSAELSEETVSVPSFVPTAEPQMLPEEEREVTYPSRGIGIPAAVRMPERAAGERVPFVVMIHGHGADRDQGGGFMYLAEELAKIGVASIRIDCPGCGESTESFRENCLSNIKTDALAAAAYMAAEQGCDPERVGLIGYSMGGRASLELVAEGSVSPYAMLLIAPAASSADLIRLFGGSEAWDRMKHEAAEHGSGEYYTGVSYQELGPKFFEDIERLENPSQKASERFTGASAVVWCMDDGVVLPEVSKGVAEALGSRTLVFERGSHACGLYGPKQSSIMSGILGLARDIFTTE